MNNPVNIAVITIALITSATAFADDTTHHRHDRGVNTRQHHQADRIKQGARSGELTKAETQQLNQERRNIRKKEREYKADGKLTAGERKELHQDLNNLSKDIHAEKHDTEKRQ